MPTLNNLRRAGERWALLALLVTSAAVGYGSLALLWRAVVPAGAGESPPPRPGGAPPAALPAAAADTAPVLRSVQRYTVPPTLRLQGTDGRTVKLEEALFDGRPVVLHFMFSSCATTCPVTNQTLMAMQRALGSRAARVHTVSLTIDPDHDTVQRLEDYARRAGRDGSFYTSDPDTSEAVQRTFDVWRGDKMNHPQVFLVSGGRGQPWVRLEGTVPPARLAEELSPLIGH